jgi:hypothetical protein
MTVVAGVWMSICVHDTLLTDTLWQHAIVDPHTCSQYPTTRAHVLWFLRCPLTIMSPVISPTVFLQAWHSGMKVSAFLAQSCTPAPSGNAVHECGLASSRPTHEGSELPCTHAGQ